MGKTCQDIGNCRGRENMTDAGNMLKRIFFNEPIYLLVQISVKFVPVFLIQQLAPSLCQNPYNQVHRRTHLCATRPQQVKSLGPGGCGSDLKNGQLQTWNRPLGNATELHCW